MLAIDDSKQCCKEKLVFVGRLKFVIFVIAIMLTK